MTEMFRRFSIGDYVWCFSNDRAWLELRRLKGAKINTVLGAIRITYVLEVPGSSTAEIYERTDDEIWPREEKEEAAEALADRLEKDRTELLKKADELLRTINSVRKGRRFMEFLI